MDLLNWVLGRSVDVLLLPFRTLPPIVGLTVVSALTAVGMLMVFKSTSDQRRIADTKRSIVAAMFEIRLFNDDPRAILRAQLEILRHNLTYLRLSLIPMAWMAVPLLLLVVQLEFHYGYGGVDPGQAVLVKAELKPDSAALMAGGTHPLLSLDASTGVRIETPAVWMPVIREAGWRITTDRRGEFELTVHAGGETATKSLLASNEIARRAPTRFERSVFNQIFYPAEPSLASNSVLKSISITYPPRYVSVFGWEVNWLIVFIALSIGFALVLRNWVGVVF